MKQGKTYFYVYILASLAGTLYVGLTDNLLMRLEQHRTGAFDGFTRRYGINRLMYVEAFRDRAVADAREKQIKKYSRAKKIALFAVSNAHWKDLSRDLFLVRRDPSLRSG
jgi:putative endonuclease